MASFTRVCSITPFLGCSFGAIFLNVIMKKFALPLLAIAAAAFFLIRKTKFAARLQYVFRGIRLRGKIFSPKIEVKLGIQNASNQSATIKSLVGNIQWKGSEFATIKMFNEVKILPNSETPVAIIAEPSVLGLYDTIRTLVKTGLKGGTLEISGTSNVNNVQIPFVIKKAL